MGYTSKFTLIFVEGWTVADIPAQRGQLKRFLTEVAPTFTPHAQGRSRS